MESPQDDEEPRHLGIVEPVEGKTLGDWGTPKLTAALESTAGPRGYRERTAIQDNSVKRRSDQGALETHDGRQTMVGPDRQPPRTREALEASLGTAQPRVGKKGEALQAHQAKVEEATSTGHGKRLEPRHQALGRVAQALGEAQNHPAKLGEHVDAFEPPKERAARDFRQQTIMTCRTLFLEHALMAFLVGRLGYLQSTGS